MVFGCVWGACGWQRSVVVVFFPPLSVVLHLQTTALKQMFIKHPPNDLVIVCKRFKRDRTKNCADINFPDSFDLRPYLSNPSAFAVRLRLCVCPLLPMYSSLSPFCRRGAGTSWSPWCSTKECIETMDTTSRPCGRSATGTGTVPMTRPSYPYVQVTIALLMPIWCAGVCPRPCVP